MADTELNNDAAEKAYAAAAAERAAPRKEPAAEVEAASTKSEAAASEAEPTSTKIKVEAEPVPAVEAKKALSPKKSAPAKRVAAELSDADAEVGSKDKKAAPATDAKNPTRSTPKLKGSSMTANTKKTAEDLTARVQDAVKDVKERAKTAFEKGQTLLSDAGEFTKGNLEAVVESGKILSEGLKTLRQTYVEDAKATFRTVQADVEELRAVKSPTEFVELQGSLARKYFDTAVDRNSKTTKAALRLANEAIKPISNRVTLAAEKVNAIY